MATMLSGASIMDGAVLVVSATEDVPQAQTEEHLMALDLIGIENIVIAQNKVDLVDRDRAVDNYRQIQEFVEGTVAEDAPIVPVSAQQEVNMDLLIDAIESEIPTPDRDPGESARMYAARSFDINRPGATAAELKGGVVGGSLVSGELSVGDGLEIRPGREVDEEGKRVAPPRNDGAIAAGRQQRCRERPTGRAARRRNRARSESDEGRRARGTGRRRARHAPADAQRVRDAVDLLDRVIGSEEGDDGDVEDINTGEPLMLTVGTATTVGAVTSAREGECEVSLKRPVCAEKGAQIAINRRVGALATHRRRNAVVVGRRRPRGWPGVDLCGRRPSRTSRETTPRSSRSTRAR